MLSATVGATEARWRNRGAAVVPRRGHSTAKAFGREEAQRSESGEQPQLLWRPALQAAPDRTQTFGALDQP